MLKILGRKNAKLAMEKWEVFYRKEDSDGTFLVVGSDNEGIAYLISKAIFFKNRKVSIEWAVMTNTDNETLETAPTTPSATGNLNDSNSNGEEAISNS